MTDIEDMSPMVEWLFSDKPIQKYKQIQYSKEYNQRPEVKARNRKYYSEYNKRPEVKAKIKAYHQRPEVIERTKAYFNSPETKQKLKEYRQRPEVKARSKTYVCEQDLVNKFVDRFGRKFVSYGELKVLSKDYSRHAHMICGKSIRSLNRRILENEKIQQRIKFISNQKPSEVYKWNIRILKN